MLGVCPEGLSPDFAKCVNETLSSEVCDLRAAFERKFSEQGITLIHGKGYFTSPKDIQVEGSETYKIHAEKTIIATGSAPQELPGFPNDGKKIHSYRSLLQLEKLPKSLVIIGGGVIGCECASLYADLGVKVIILEAQSNLLSLEAKTCPWP